MADSCGVEACFAILQNEHVVTGIQTVHGYRVSVTYAFFLLSSGVHGYPVQGLLDNSH